MNTFSLIAFALTVGLLTKPIGFIPASIVALIVALLIGFFQTKSELDNLEKGAESNKQSTPSDHNEKSEKS